MHYQGLMRTLIFILVLTLGLSARAETTGEARYSSQNSMKEVEDKKPLLQMNMMDHLAKAAMYQAQMNFPMAAIEMQKANMLKQQLQVNDDSHDKNSDRLDTATFTSDAAQSQIKLVAPAISGAPLDSPRPSATTTAAGAEPGGTRDTENLVWKDSPKEALSASTELASSPEIANTEIGEAVTSAEAAAPLQGALGDLAAIEAAYNNALGAPPASESVTTAPTATTVEDGSVSEALPVIATTRLLASVKKSDKEKDGFWKENKEDKRKAKARRARAKRNRGIAISPKEVVKQAIEK